MNRFCTAYEMASLFINGICAAFRGDFSNRAVNNCRDA